MKRIHIGGDHAGFTYKAAVIEELTAKGFEVIDHGPVSEDSCDYPDHVHPLAKEVVQHQEMGILICGSANGVCMTANKYKDIRAAYVWNNEISELSRQHNDANVICLPARFISLDNAKQFINTFLSTEFEGGRHQNRVNKIAIS